MLCKQFLRKRRQSIALAVGPSVGDEQVLPFGVAEGAKPFANFGNAGIVFEVRAEDADAEDPRPPLGTGRHGRQKATRQGSQKCPALLRPITSLQSERDSGVCPLLRHD
jgi:hypothetical protein